MTNTRFGLGSWRLFLAALVAISHLWAGMLHGPAAYAVWGFFVLSGYLMTHVLNEKYGFARDGIYAYLHNRFIRIFPGFWAASLIGMVLIAWLAQLQVDPRRLNPAFGMPRDLQEWLFNLTLMPFFPRWNGPVPVANALSIEVGYYALVLYFAQHRSAAWCALAFGVFITAAYGLSMAAFNDRYASFLPAAPAFALGSLIYHYRPALARFRAPRLSVIIWLLHCGIVLIKHDWPWTIGLYVSMFLSAWVVVSLASLRTQGKLDTVLGELSYPFYLLHSTAGALLLTVFGYDRPLSFALCGLALALFASWLMVRWIDRPLGMRKSRAVLPDSAQMIPALR